MKKEINRIENKNKGAAMMIVVLFFMLISLTILIGIITPVVREFKIASENFNSKKSYFIAESGAEDIIYRIKSNMGIGTSGSDRTLFLDDSYFPIPTEITDLGNSRKRITTIGDIDTNKRKLELEVTSSTGVSFNYGVLVGQGGITLNGSGKVIGNVYANGPITGDSSGYITGTAISANSPDMFLDQSSEKSVPDYSLDFGTSSRKDLAQTFVVSGSESPINKIQVYLKKVGNPSNINVYIRCPSCSNQSQASGTILASSVGSSYGWIDIPLAPNPNLDPTKEYWLFLDAQSSSNTNYYTIAQSYNNYDDGLSYYGVYNSTWYPFSSGEDIFFRVYLGGIMGSITGSSGSQWNQLHVGTVSGTARAHTVNYTHATGNIYCKVGTGNNKSCIDQADPVYIPQPVSDTDIEGWKNDAISGGTYNGNYTVGWAGATLGPKKIVGNLVVNSGGTLVVTGNIFVTGSITLSGGGLIKLAPSYGSDDGVIISNGNIAISGGGHASGSGTSGSYIMLLSLSDSSTAISVTGGAGAVIVYAPKGTVLVKGGASLKEVTGNKVLIDGNSSVTYESGLANNNFSSGPSGSWSIDEWKESE